MTLYCLEFQTSTMPRPRELCFDTAASRALMEITMSATPDIVVRRYEREGDETDVHREGVRS